MTEIPLTPNAIKSLLKDVYVNENNSDPDRCVALVHALEPYCVTLSLLTEGTHIFWIAMPMRKYAHPMYHTVKQIDTLCKEPGSKRSFIYIATSICHVWCICYADDVFILSRTRSNICAYEHMGVAIPYIWIHIDLLGMIDVIQRDSGMPMLKIKLKRFTDYGIPLNPIDILLDHVAKQRVNLTIDIEKDIPSVSVRSDQKVTTNFLVIFTEGANNYVLKRSYLVCTAMGATYPWPLMVHPIDREGVE